MKAAEATKIPSLPRVPVARLVGHDGPVVQVRFTDDGKYCVTAGYDRTVRLWNPSRLDPAYQHSTATPAGTASSAIGRRRGLLLESNNNNNNDEIPLEQLPRAFAIQTYEASSYPVAAVAVNQDSTQLCLAGDKTCLVVDLVTTQILRRFTGHIGRINAVAVMGNGDLYLSASYDATVRIWDGKSRSNTPIQILQCKDSVTSVQVALDSPLIRTASVDGIVRTYDIRQGRITLDDFGCPITGMAVTHDDQLLVASGLDGSIRLLEIDRGELVNIYTGAHVAGQYGLECCVTANDTTVVTGSQDGQAVLYDLIRATRVQALQGHLKPVCSVAAHPKREHSSVVITASYDGIAVVWGHDASYMHD